MNTLITTTLILSLLSFIAFKLMIGQSTTFTEFFYTKTLLEADRKCRNNVIKERYAIQIKDNKITKDNSNIIEEYGDQRTQEEIEQIKKEKEAKAKIFVSLHEHPNLKYDVHKINLYPLATLSGDPLQLFKEIVATILFTHYKNIKHFDLKKAEELTEILYQKALSNKDEVSLLEELIPDESDLKKIYYKMLLGTAKNYPPLSFIFFIKNSREKQVIRLNFVSFAVLEGLCGEKFVKSIDEEERKKWDNYIKKPTAKASKYLSDKEWKSFLDRHKIDIPTYPNILEFFSYSQSKQTSHKTSISVDKATGIIVNRINKEERLEVGK